MDSVRLSIQRLDKAFATPVLRNVSLSIDRGEIRGIVGENGAGKSTLAKIVAGMLPRDGGRIILDGIPYDPVRPADALANGVSLATQETSIIDSLSVAENICLSHLPRKHFAIHRDGLNERSTDLLRRVGLAAIAPESSAGVLGVAERQLLELAKALARGAKVLLLDEPTAALAAPQVERVHEIIAELAHAGTSVIYVSHRLEDVLRAADAISVLRDGRVVKTAPAAELSVPALLDGMTGQFPAMPRQRSKRGSGAATVVDVRGITTQDLPHHISFSCSRGEIAGLAGLAGSGRGALLRAMFGLVPLTDGRVLRQDGETRVPIADPGEAARRGMGFLGEDRQSMGLYPGRSVLTNLMVPGAPGRWPASRIIDRDSELRAFEELRGRLGIRCQGPRQDISQLSGGNQQKTLLARWVYRDCEVLLLNEPTRGVDVATKYAIYGLLGDLAARGTAILIASSEIEELMTVCDRILVLSDRRLVRDFKRGDWTEAAILEAAFKELAGPLTMAGNESRSAAAPRSGVP